MELARYKQKDIKDSQSLTKLIWGICIYVVSLCALGGNSWSLACVLYGFLLLMYVVQLIYNQPKQVELTIFEDKLVEQAATSSVTIYFRAITHVETLPKVTVSGQSSSESASTLKDYIVWSEQQFIHISSDRYTERAVHSIVNALHYKGCDVALIKRK